MCCFAQPPGAQSVSNPQAWQAQLGRGGPCASGKGCTVVTGLCSGGCRLIVGTMCGRRAWVRVGEGYVWQKGGVWWVVGAGVFMLRFTFGVLEMVDDTAWRGYDNMRFALQRDCLCYHVNPAHDHSCAAKQESAGWRVENVQQRKGWRVGHKEARAC